jgi:tetratricopeptide (TPR) repeat protein
MKAHPKSSARGAHQMNLQRPNLLIALFIPVLVSSSDLTAATLFSTVRNAPLYVVDDGEMYQRDKVSPETLVVGTRQIEYLNQVYHYVRFLWSSRQPGWIRETDLDEIASLVKEEIEFSDSSAASEDEGSLPLVIRHQRSVRLKRAWLSIQKIIKNNETLPEDKRVPEPYFARAEIWMAVDNYVEAMTDYLTALRYASSSGRELQTYIRYYSKVEKTIERFALLPAPPSGVSPDARRKGSHHFGFGVTEFRIRNHTQAVRHFGNAISMEPDNPLYWYYRSVASRRSGDSNHAVYDALYGTLIESKKYSPYKSRQMAQGLQHIQGEDRIWLESFRLGDPSDRIIRFALEQTQPHDNVTQRRFAN